MHVRTVLLGLGLTLLAHAADADFDVFPPSGGRSAGTVVLLHGLNRSSGSMEDMARALAAAGFRAVNVDYPSGRYTIEKLTEIVDAEIRSCCAPALRDGIHFVTHSLGGVLVRYWTSLNPDVPVGRTVMLAPPSQGSELVDELRDSAVFKLFTGPAGQELGTDAASVPNRLGPVGFPLGVIAGSVINPFYSWLIPGDDDGIVAVDRTRTAGMKDFIVLEQSHTFIMYSSEAIHQTLHFLHEGRFDRESSQ